MKYFLFLFAIGFTAGWLLHHYLLCEPHISEAERQEAFDEGQRVGNCVSNRLHLKLDTGECFQ